MENIEHKKILILSASPINTARLRQEEEVREIGEGLQLSKFREKFAIYQAWALRLKDLRRAMLEHEPQIVHFCGHGKENGILVEDENGNAVLVNPDALADLFELFSDHVKCVLLNACYSQLQAEAINRHIDYVIGMRQGIHDKAAVEFAIGFYDALGAGRSFEEAFKFGCNAIQLYNLPDSTIPIFNERSVSISQRLKALYRAYSTEETPEIKDKLQKQIEENEKKLDLMFQKYDRSSDVSVENSKEPNEKEGLLFTSNLVFKVALTFLVISIVLMLSSGIALKYDIIADSFISIVRVVFRLCATTSALFSVLWIIFRFIWKK